jgi:hypothetical protein
VEYGEALPSLTDSLKEVSSLDKNSVSLSSVVPPKMFVCGLASNWTKDQRESQYKDLVPKTKGQNHSFHG